MPPKILKRLINMLKIIERITPNINPMNNLPIVLTISIRREASVKMLLIPSHTWDTVGTITGG